MIAVPYPSAMRRSRLLPALLLAFLILAIAGFFVCTGGDSTPKPNVLLISIDSLRRDYLGVHGREPLFAKDVEVSPNLDALAREGAVFDDALTTSSWTLPAHVALMTGMSDRWHGVEIDDFRRDPLHRTLAASFRDAGYETAGFFSGPYLDPKYGFDDGFEGYRSGMATPEEKAARLKQWTQRFTTDGQLQMNAELLAAMTDRISHIDVTSPRVNEMAESFLDQLDDEPFFLFLHYFDAHYDHIPEAAEPGLGRKFDPDYQGKVTGLDWITNPLVRDPKPPRTRKLSDRDLQHIQALYEAEIHWVDRHIGVIIDKLKASGRWENTIVAVVSDHGDEFFERGSIGHRSTLYAEQLRVPLIVRVPGAATSGARVDGIARIYDVAPTLLDYAGLKPLPHAEGSSLRPLLEGEDDGRGALGRIYYQEGGGPNIQDAWRDGRYTVIRRLDPARQGSGPQGILVQQRTGTASRPAFLVFDRREDPLEKNALAADDPRYAEAIAAFREDFEGSETGFQSVPHSPLGDRYGPRKSAEERIMLDELGYTSGATNAMRAPPLRAFPPPQK